MDRNHCSVSRATRFFEGKRSGAFVVGRVMATFLVQSGLERKVVAYILEMADLDKDGKFDRDEFVVAMHLAVCVSKRGMPVPKQLPPYLIPNSKKALVQAKQH